MEKMMYVQCPTCKGSGSILKSVRGMLMNTLCPTCKGDGGQHFSKKALDAAYKKRKDDLRKLLYGKK